VDPMYMEMVEKAIAGWHLWNATFGDTLYHQTGVTMLTRDPMEPGGFEYESYTTLLNRGHAPERMNADEIRRRFPAWSNEYVDGFFHGVGGYAESGRVIATLAAQAASLGIQVTPGTTITRLAESDNRVTGVETATGSVINADHVLVAVGAWTLTLLPELKRLIRVTGHPVFHLRPDQPDFFAPPLFATFTADVARTGWYGFPIHPTEGVVKVANHGIGLPLHPDDPRVVTSQDEENLRAFLSRSFPALASSPIVYTRRCLYCDTLDEHFLIASHPARQGLSVATGGSGHGFKFAPILGPLIADMVEKRDNPWLERFRWRALSADTKGQEATRHHG